MKFVISAPQHTAPNTHTPMRRVRAKHISTSDSSRRSSPFSPRKVMSFISGVSTGPSAPARECIIFRIALS